MQLDITLQLTAFLSYLLGAVPFGLLITRVAGMGDVRKIGSGNIGATNVLRTGRKDLAALTLLLDGGKGAVAVVIASLYYGQDQALIAGLFAVIGHNFPFWLQFKGGKGVATTLGVLLALAWPVGIIACAVWLATAKLFKYSSLAALVALGTAPFTSYLLAGERMATVVALLAVLGFIRHHENIRRLLSGTESKIGQKAKDTEQDPVETP
ncbi:MAG: glycerol-3-phosphate 1-O-acyltransferase PlsY [Magnetospiraceae bacterium]